MYIKANRTKHSINKIFPFYHFLFSLGPFLKQIIYICFSSQISLNFFFGQIEIGIICIFYAFSSRLCQYLAVSYTLVPWVMLYDVAKVDPGFNMKLSSFNFLGDFDHFPTTC